MYPLAYLLLSKIDLYGMKTNIWSSDCLVTNFLQAYVEASMLSIMN